jgi:hypothetical protein
LANQRFVVNEYKDGGQNRQVGSIVLTIVAFFEWETILGN